MSRAIAIAAIQPNAFDLMLDSARNTASLVTDFLYGTPQRVNRTFALALLLAVAGSFLSSSTVQAFAVCHG